ncbi:MAG: hypothetical protein NT038_00335 [Euryarchaeota archaeon]|nr:hypothetical protein [Euryarchaeota archaeon]
MLILPAIVPSGLAETSNASTNILHFTEYIPFSLDSLDAESGSTQMSTDIPTKTNDSEWPPSLFVKNKLIPTINKDEWLSWFGLWTIYKFALEFGDITEEDSEIPIDMLSSFFELMNPFKVTEEYLYTGAETREINGNVLFNLYLSSSSKPLHKDSVKISISNGTDFFGSGLILSQEIKNTTTTIKPTIIPGRIKPYLITLDLSNEHVVLKENSILLFSVEIIPSERTIGNILTKLSERGFEDKALTIMGKLSDFLSKRKITKLQDLGATLKEFLNMSDLIGEDGVNLTLADLADLADGVLASSFIFGSSTHDSTVTLPLSIPIEQKENEITYYLHKEDIVYQMVTEIPTSNTTISEKLKDTTRTWSGNGPVQSKILKNAEANIYMDYRNLIDLRKITLTATLSNEGGVISNSSITLDKTKLLDLIKKNNHLTTFIFSNINDKNKELIYDEPLSLDIAIADGPQLGQRTIQILYDSVDCPSSLHLFVEDTTHIKFTYTSNPADAKIVPGGIIDYTLNITSEGKDPKININVIQKEKIGGWNIVTASESIVFSAGGYQLVHVLVDSTDTTQDAYDDSLDMIFEVSGKTGKATAEASALVTRAAITYDLSIRVDNESLDVKKGVNATFNFYIKNNNIGASDDDDSYQITVTSKNGWEKKYIQTVSKVINGKERIVQVTVSVPTDTSFSSDTLTFKATSKGNSAASAALTVTIQVIGNNVLYDFFDAVYKFFDSAADQLGLKDTFGSDAAIVLALILFVLFFFIIIVIALLLTQKVVKFQCIDRIQEIDPDGEARFEIVVLNPTRKTRTYEVFATRRPVSSHWDASVEPQKLVVEPKQSITIVVTVKPTSQIEPNDWVETIIRVNSLGKKKQTEIQTMTMVTNVKAELAIKNMFHWPRDFKEGERITTSFRVENVSKVSARKVKVSLTINGEEKNKVEDLIIPGYGYAEITIPWIAKQGKNDIRVTVNEQ